MESFFMTFQICLAGYLIARHIALSKKVDEILNGQKNLDKNIAHDLESVEKALLLIAKKTEDLPNNIQENMNRSLLSLRDYLEAAKPMKPNNWDSVRIAFKGPVKNERD